MRDFPIRVLIIPPSFEGEEKDIKIVLSNSVFSVNRSIIISVGEIILKPVGTSLLLKGTLRRKFSHSDSFLLFPVFSQHCSSLTLCRVET